MVGWIKDRRAHSLPWRPLCEAVPTTQEDWALGLLEAAGWRKPPTASSAPWGLRFAVTNEEEGWRTGEMRTDVVVTFDDQEKLMLPQIIELNNRVQGLGSWVLAQLGAAWVPGLALPADIFDYYISYRLQGNADDSQASDYLYSDYFCESEETSETDIDVMLPSALADELGGRPIVEARKHARYKRKPSLKTLMADLAQGGVKTPERLAALLLKDLPKAQANAHHWRGTEGASSLTNAVMVLSAELKEHSTSYQFLNELYHADQQGGEELFGEVHFAVGREPKPKRRATSPATGEVEEPDELVRVASLLNMWQVVFDIITELQQVKKKP